MKKDNFIRTAILAVLTLPLILCFHENIYVQLLGGLYIFTLAYLKMARVKRSTHKV